MRAEFLSVRFFPFRLVTPVTANNADAQISYTYDSIGRRSSLTQTVAGLAKTVNFVYDAANRLLSRSPEGLAVESRTFTNRGQLASVSLGSPGTAGVPPALVASFSYDPAGRETSRTYGNGLNTTSGYSRADNLITSINVANKPELSFNYSYDSNKNVTAEQRGGSMALYSWNATFDAMDRLNSQNDGVQTRSWSLDLVGNTTSETLNGNAEARTLNDMHAPTAAGNKAYSYDSNGQMTVKPGYALVWDARNHLVSSSSIGSPGVPPAAAVSYRYDAFGNRVSKGSTRYLLVDNQVVAEFNGAASKQYCYGFYIDEVLAEQKSESGVTESLYYHRNRQYNTVALTDAVGAIVELYSTDAMGRVKAFDAAATTKAAPTATTVLFTGRVFDAETGFYYFRARYFEPKLGVFISRDPLGFVDGMSVYNGFYSIHIGCDPSGHKWEKKSDKIYEAGADGDTLQELATIVTKTASDWPCIWILPSCTKNLSDEKLDERLNKKGWEGYPKAKKGAAADVSNLIDKNGPEFSIYIGNATGEVALFIPFTGGGFAAQSGRAAAENIKGRAAEGDNPIMRLMIVGHHAKGFNNMYDSDGKGGRIDFQSQHLFDVATEKNNALNTKRSAARRIGPPKCWFCRESNIWAAGCHTAFGVADDWASRVQRISGSVHGTTDYIWANGGGVWVGGGTYVNGVLTPVNIPNNKAVNLDQIFKMNGWKKFGGTN